MLWDIHRANLVWPTVKESKDSWEVITDDVPSLQVLLQYSSRFCVEELFLCGKSGAFGLEDSRLWHTDALNCLDLIAAVAILYATTTIILVWHYYDWITTVDPHYRRGLSYFKIGLCCLEKVFHLYHPAFVLTARVTHGTNPSGGSPKSTGRVTSFVIKVRVQLSSRFERMAQTRIALPYLFALGRGQESISWMVCG